jgi:hypothetical protein
MSLLACAGLPRLSWADAGNPAFIAAARETNGDYALFGLSAQGKDVFRVSIPARGHAAAAHPTAPEAVAFARRPGRFAMVLNCVTGGTSHQLDAPAGRHFYGHGAFLEEGAILATTENNIATGEGVIGLWARDEGYVRIGEIASGGIGPHDILRLPGDVLAVANGGIRTHPDKGRDKLNLDTMRPNLSYLTTHGGIEEVVTLPEDLHQASIRHLAWHNGLLGFAMQWQGDLFDPVPLLGLHRRGGAAQLCEADLGEQLAMKGYAGSIAMTNNEVCITSPRGGRMHVFDTNGAFRTSLNRADICGIAASDHGLMATDGLGAIWHVDQNGLSRLGLADRAWDNHLIRL